MKKYLLILYILISDTARSQTHIVRDDLARVIYYFFNGSHDASTMDAIRQRNAPSEAIIILLELDSTGRVDTIRLMAEDSNKDSGFAILSRLTPDYFKHCQNEKYKDKTIVIPLVVQSAGYATRHVARLYDLTGTPREVGGLVIGKGLFLDWPEIKYDEATPSIKVKPK